MKLSFNSTFLLFFGVDLFEIFKKVSKWHHTSIDTRNTKYF